MLVLFVIKPHKHNTINVYDGENPTVEWTDELEENLNSKTTIWTKSYNTTEDAMLVMVRLLEHEQKELFYHGGMSSQTIYDWKKKILEYYTEEKKI